MFQHSLFGREPPADGYFRPLTLLTFALNSQFALDNPAGYRIVNIGLHLLVVAMVFVLFSQFTGRWLSTFSALLFAVHPVNVQAVSYISSRSEPLYTAIGLLSLIFWHRGSLGKGGQRLLHFTLSFVAFFVGLFAKESMVVIPVVIIMMDVVWSRSCWRRRVEENSRWYAGFVVAFGIYLWIRLGSGAPLALEGTKQLDFILRVAFALKLFVLYLEVVFYPAHLSLFRVVHLPESLFEWQVLMGLLLISFLLVAAYLLREWREILFGILWFLITILPVLNLTLLNLPMMEHWLYLPLIGLALAFVGAVRCLAEAAGEMRGFAVGLCFVALLLSARTIARNWEWHDLIRLFSQDVKRYPGNPIAWTWLGESLVRQGRLEEAIQAYKAALTIAPNRVGSWVFLGEALFLAGKTEEAGKAFTTAIAVSPRDRSRIEDFKKKCCLKGR